MAFALNVCVFVFMIVIAEKALDNLNFTHLNGKCIRIAYSNREGNHRKSGQGNIFVKVFGQFAMIFVVIILS